MESLKQELANYLDSDKVAQVARAYDRAKEAHEGQMRASGEAYITHPLAVARILSGMKMDHHSLMAAMLHDVIEDTGVAKEELSEEFGETVAELVDGVSKLTTMEFTSQEEKQAKNFEKMAIAMARDIRVIIVKLADRLHNMRTLGPLKPSKRRRVARETLEIYARIAARLGMHDIRVELENRGFEALYPMRAKRLRVAVNTTRKKQLEMVEQTRQALENQLKEWGIKATVSGREKHLYSIYRKLKDKKKKFNEVTDVFGFRIVTKSIDDCYRALGCAHMLYKPFPGDFKDYIALPKVNGYQSIHTTLNGTHNVPVEVQIRTEKMDAIAAAGISAHWLYKSEEEENTSQSRARRWVNNLLEMQQQAGDSMEFIEHVKNDLFSDEVFVFTPKGKIVELPAGSTAVDFAYSIHTEIGNCTVACRINNRLASLSQALENGQRVEIITREDSRPRAIWLNTVKSSKARSAIHHALKNHQQQDAIDLGRRMLVRTMATIQTSLDDIPADKMAQVFAELECKNLDQLFSEIGLGKRLSTTVAKLLVPEQADQVATKVQSPLTVDSTDGTMISLARCCFPIPGDDIIGVISPGKGLVIHLDSCNNIADARQDESRLNDVSWSPEVSGEFPVDLLITTESHRGIFAELASRISELGANIEKIMYQQQDASINQIRMTLGVKNRVHLADIMKRIRGMRFVEKIARSRH